MVLLIKLSKDVRETRRTKFLLRYIELARFFVAGRKQLRVEGGFKVLSKFLVRKINFPESRHCFIDSKNIKFSRNLKYSRNLAVQKYETHPTPPENNLDSYLVNNLPTRYNFQFNKFENFSTPNVFRLLHLIRKTAKPGLWFIKLTICFLETSLTKKQSRENKEPGEKRRKRN